MASVVQSKSGFQPYGSGLPYTSIAATFDTAATAGNLLLAFLAIDKTSGTIVVPTGFTLVHDQSDSSLANGAMAYKKAAGGEQTITWTWSNGSNSASILIREISGLPSDWTLNGLGENTSLKATTGTSLALSATAASSGSLGVAMACIDGRTRWGTGPAWSDSFVAEAAIHHNHTSACSLAVAMRDSIASGAVATTASWTTADAGYAAIGIFGSPGAPPATTPALVSRRLGAGTNTRLRAVTKTTDATRVRLVVSTSSSMSSPTVGAWANVDAQGYASLEITGLTANTLYYYAFDLEGTSSTPRVNAGDSMKTLGASSFGFAFGSCQATNASPAIFDAIIAKSPEFFLHLGDYWYTDTDTTDVSAYRSRHEYAIGRAKNALLFGKVNTRYIWSDHDFCGNSSGPYSTGHNAVEQAYRQCVPHDDLPTAGIYHSFEAGKVLVIMLDTRFARDLHTSGSVDNRTLLGATQKQWLKDLLLANKKRPKIIASDGPWCAATQDNDHWGCYRGERLEIANYINANDIKNVVMIGGDVHALAADSGPNSVGGFPSFQAAPLDQTGKSLAGPWEKGPYPSTGGVATTETYRQFGWIDVVESNAGNTVTLTYRAYKEDGTEAFTPTEIVMDVSAVDTSTSRDTSVGFVS